MYIKKVFTLHCWCNGSHEFYVVCMYTEILKEYTYIHVLRMSYFFLFYLFVFLCLFVCVSNVFVRYVIWVGGFFQRLFPKGLFLITFFPRLHFPRRMFFKGDFSQGYCSKRGEFYQGHFSQGYFSQGDFFPRQIKKTENIFFGGKLPFGEKICPP